MRKQSKIIPQEGFQQEFLSSPADVVIGGGGAGVGKTYAELLESLRHKDVEGFSCLFFRRTYSQITAPGGLWDEAQKIYPLFGGVQGDMKFTFPSGAKVVFSHMQHEKNKLDWQGAQIPLIIFDELTHFTKEMFFYMLSRNRSMCGVKPYMRATCNPDADSFVRDLIDWWIDEDGYVIKERSGIIRYMTVYMDEIVWGDTRQEVFDKVGTLQSLDEVLSFTFIEGELEHNKMLLENDPSYKSKLLALSEEDQLRLLRRNWNVKVDKTTLINYIRFKDTFTNEWVQKGQKYITADIATSGSDLLSIWVWEGRRAIDLELVEKNNGKQAVEMIKRKQQLHFVPSSNICYDADGVGGGLTGFLPNAIEFHGGGKVYGNEKYMNRRAQCYFHLAHAINQTFPKSEKDAYYISPEILQKKYPFNTPKQYKGRTIEWVLLHQLKAIRQNKPDAEGKKSIIKKEEMKIILGGISPDLLDGLMMREVFDFINVNSTKEKVSKSRLGIF